MAAASLGVAEEGVAEDRFGGGCIDRAKAVAIGPHIPAQWPKLPKNPRLQINSKSSISPERSLDDSFSDIRAYSPTSFYPIELGRSPYLIALPDRTRNRPKLTDQIQRLTMGDCSTLRTKKAGRLLKVGQGCLAIAQLMPD